MKNNVLKHVSSKSYLCPRVFQRICGTGRGKKSGDLTFLRHHVPPREPTDLCVEEQIEPLGPHKRQKSLVLRVLDFMTLIS